MKDSKAKSKKPLNLLVEAKLLDDAKSVGVNFSALLDKALRQEMAKHWAKNNADAIKLYNERIEKDGVWLDDLRAW